MPTLWEPLEPTHEQRLDAQVGTGVSKPINSPPALG